MGFIDHNSNSDKIEMLKLWNFMTKTKNVKIDIIKNTLLNIINIGDDNNG